MRLFVVDMWVCDGSWVGNLMLERLSSTYMRLKNNVKGSNREG